MKLTLDQALQKGIEAHKAGQIQDAERLYAAILKAQPGHPDVNHNMGVLAVGIGKVKESLPFFKAALEANPSIGQFGLSYIDALMKLGRLADAQAVFYQEKDKGAKGEGFNQLEQQLSEHGLKVNETNTVEAEDLNLSKPNILDTTTLDQALRLGKRKSKDGQLEEANNIYQDILEKFPKNKQALIALRSSDRGEKVVPQDPPPNQLQSIINLYNQGQLQQSLSETTHMLETFSNSVFLYNISGACNVGLMQYDAAIDSYKKAINIKPDYADAYNNMGVALKNVGDIEAAINSYRQALKIKPDYAEAYYNMGNAQKDQGNLGGAVGSYQQALKIKPDYAEAHYNMGNTQKDKGDLGGAIGSFKQALKIKPDYADAYLNMGMALQDKGDLDAAINSYQQALKIKPDYAEAYNNIGNALKDKGSHKAAIESYKEALKLKPDYADAHHNLGNMMFIEDNLDEALESFTQALNFNPDFAECYNNIGAAMKEKGDFQAALISCRQAISIKPHFEEAYNNLGLIFQQLGELEQAEAHYKQAIAINPNFEDAYHNLGLMLFEASQYQQSADYLKLSNSNTSKHYLLRCLYRQNKKDPFYDQLDYFISKGEVHPIIGSLGCRSLLRYGIERPNLFCKNPLNYVLKTNLICQYDFEELFVNTVKTILNEKRVPNRIQGLLTNGYQSVGNLFNLEPNLTKGIKEVIELEVRKYIDKFKDSKEGLITNWPTEYSLKGWLIRMGSGGSLRPHMHENGWISGSIYINVPSKSKIESGNLVVCIDDEKNESCGEENRKSIDVVTGSLCLFPASLLHYTIPFESEEDRIVLAFDVVPKKLTLKKA